MRRRDLPPPTIERCAAIPTGLVFLYGGRALRVARVYGTGASAPVIVEEMRDGPRWLKGQFALWCVDGVSRAIAANPLWKKET